MTLPAAARKEKERPGSNPSFTSPPRLAMDPSNALANMDLAAERFLAEVVKPCPLSSEGLLELVSESAVEEAAEKLMQSDSTAVPPLVEPALIVGLVHEVEEFRASVEASADSDPTLSRIFPTILEGLAQSFRGIGALAEVSRRASTEYKLKLDLERFTRLEPAFSPSPPRRSTVTSWPLALPFVDRLPLEDQGVYHANALGREHNLLVRGEGSAHRVAFHLRVLLALYEQWFVERYPPSVFASTTLAWSSIYFRQYAKCFVPLLPQATRISVEESLARVPAVSEYSPALLAELVWPHFHASPRLALEHADYLLTNQHCKIGKNYVDNQCVLEEHIVIYDAIHLAYAAPGLPTAIQIAVPEGRIAYSFVASFRPMHAPLVEVLVSYVKDQKRTRPEYEGVLKEMFSILASRPHLRVCYSPTIPNAWQAFADPSLIIYDPMQPSERREGQPRDPSLFCVVCFSHYADHPTRRHGHEAPFCPLVLGNYLPDHPLSNPGPAVTQEEATRRLRELLAGRRPLKYARR